MMLTISHRVRTDIRDIIVAEAGEKGNKTIKEMNTNSNLSLANRKQLADMLGNQYDGMRYRAIQKFREQREELEKKLIKEYAEQKGATKLVSQIEITERKLKDLRDELSHLDFSLDSDLDLRVVSHTSLDRTIDSRIEKELGTADAIDARFRSAQIAMMTIASLEDAEKILNSVSALC
jgi:hypothetical protein